MKKRIRGLCMVLALLMTVLLCACGPAGPEGSKPSGSENTEGEKTVLTDRQIEILREGGLPEDYEALTDLQKSAITAIERFLTHLETTYHREFVYNGYVPAGGVDPEYLTAYAKDDPYRTLITVYRKYDGEQFIYHDDYLEISAADAYQAAVEAYFADIIPEGDIWFYVTVDQIAEGDQNIMKRAGGNVLAFAKNTFADGQEVKKLVEDYGNWLASLDGQFPAGMQLYVQNEEDYAQTDRFNYSNMIHGGKYVYYYSCSVNSDGDLSVHGDSV